MSIWYTIEVGEFVPASEPAWRAGNPDFAEAVRLEGYTHAEPRDGYRWYEDPSADRWLFAFGWQDDFVVTVETFPDLLAFAATLAPLMATGIQVRSARR